MIPEIAIKSLLDMTINLIRDDYAAVSSAMSEEDTLLYQALFGYDDGIQVDSDVTISRYQLDLFQQAKSIFIDRDVVQDDRALRTVLMFAPDMMSKPCIHITSPSDSLTDMVVNGDYDVVDGLETYGGRYDSTYTLLITSTNNNEVLIIYYVMMHMLISVYDTFVVKTKFDDFEISGQELRISHPQAQAEGIVAKGISIKNKRSVRIRTPKSVQERINNILIGKQKIKK